nr:hypothetical protein CDL12_24508 [Ipomoea batatas]
MAKIQRMRFSTEVAPAKFLSRAKRPQLKMLDTINEEEAYVSTISSSLDRSFDQEKYCEGCPVV